MNTRLPLFLLAITAFLTGCTFTSIKKGDSSMTRLAVGTQLNVGSLKLVNGADSVELKGYANDQVDVAAAVVSAAVKAAVK